MKGKVCRVLVVSVLSAAILMTTVAPASAMTWNQWLDWLANGRHVISGKVVGVAPATASLWYPEGDFNGQRYHGGALLYTVPVAADGSFVFPTVRTGYFRLVVGSYSGLVQVKGGSDVVDVGVITAP